MIFASQPLDLLMLPPAAPYIQAGGNKNGGPVNKLGGPADGYRKMELFENDVCVDGVKYNGNYFNNQIDVRIACTQYGIEPYV